MDASNEPLETISKVEILEVSSLNSESQEGVNQTTDTVNVQEQDHSETLNATTEIAVPDATAEITEVSATTTEPIVTKEPVIDNTEVTESTVLAETTQNDITTSDNQQEEHNINTNETTSNTTSSEIPEDLKPPLHGENIVIINNTDQEENTVGEATVQNFLNTDSNVEEVQKLSDDEINVDDVSSDDESSSDESSSSDDDDDDSSSDDDDDDDMKELGDLDDEEEESNDGPVKSTHEILNEKAPTLPEDYKIPENAPIEEIGEITGMVENTLIIKAKTSGEFRVLQEKSIFCFEDRTVIGPLFEIFGRVQQPVYSVKFNSEDEFNKFKGCKGKSVYYVVPDSQFLYTDSIKHIKGTDASNCHDEELPKEEQEYSDDEKELAAKQAKKKKKNSNKNKRAIELNPVPQTKRQNVAPYTPLSSTSNRTGLQNRGRLINPQNTNVYNNQQQQLYHQHHHNHLSNNINRHNLNMVSHTTHRVISTVTHLISIKISHLNNNHIIKTRETKDTTIHISKAIHNKVTHSKATHSKITHNKINTSNPHNNNHTICRIHKSILLNWHNFKICSYNIYRIVKT